MQATKTPSRDTTLEFLLRLARSLHVFGTSAPLLEDTMQRVAARFGVVASFFSTPTSLFVAFDAPEEQRTTLLRLEPGSVDLGRLVEVDLLRRAVVNGHLDLAEGVRRLDAVLSAPARYGPWWILLAFGLTSAAGARLLGGGCREILVGASVGLAAGLLAHGVRRRPQLTTLYEPAAAALAALLVAAAASALGRLNTSIAMVAGLLVLLPGFTLTTAIRELASQHLSSGTARLTGAMVTFVGMAFGLALGRAAGRSLFVAPFSTSEHALPAATEALALLAAAGGFTVLFRARRRDVVAISLGVLVGFGAARLGATFLSPEASVGLAAAAVGLVANIYSRWMDRPSAVVATPGIMILVPGSVGFRSVTSLLERDVLSAVDTAFQMFLAAMALVAGLVFANATVRPRTL